MLSMGSNDGRKGLGFGFGGEMEEAELEEGEAFYYQEDEAGFEPDVALSSLSYIDEKIKHVLGHFQKDFEGGVSAENLGAKFGGYGSFLPSHQRSPSIRSCPRTPQKVQTYSTPKSPNNMPDEGGQNHQSLASGSHSIRHASVSTNAHLSSTVPYVGNSSKKGSTPACGDVNNRSANATDQKMLKLRIKVGSNNVSARNNVAIYSGLGLISPSSSLEDSPNMEFCAPDESPLTIIQGMSSFLVAGEYLLSPLPDCLLRLTVKEYLLTSKKPGTVPKGSQALPTMLSDESLAFRETKGYGERKTKSVEKNGKVTEVQSGNGKNSRNDMSDHIKKEIGVETPGRRELVSNAVKLPLLSSSKGITDKMERPINNDNVRGPYGALEFCREVNKGDIKDWNFSSEALVKEEVFESATSIDPAKVSKSGSESVLLKEKPSLKSCSAVKVREEKRTSAQKDISLDLLKDGRGKGEKSSNTFRVDSDRLKGRADYNSGSEDPYAQKATHKAISYEPNAAKTSQRKEGKKKKKGSQSNGNSAVELPKDCSMVIKDRKSSQSQDSSANRSDTLKSCKEPGKLIGRERHRVSLGVTKVQQMDNRIDSMEMSFIDKLKDSKLDTEKDTHSFVEKSKERFGAKKVENPSTSEVYANNSSTAALTSNGQTVDAVIAPVLPVVIEENWVCCDKCQKWRLLPYGTKPDLLGENWICSMLNWLPGMNKCNISEEETTKALNALYLPVPERQNNVQGQYVGATSGNVSADVHHLDQSHKSSLVMPDAGRKKHGPKDASNAFGSSSLTTPPISIKKNQQPSVKSRNLTDASQCPLESKLIDSASFPDTGKSTDFAIDRHRCKQKVLESQSDEGDYTYQSGKHSKTKSKREVDHDYGFVASKKIKKEGSHCNYEDWQSDCDVTRKEIPNSSNDLLIKVTRKDPQKHNGCSSSKDLKGKTRENSQSSGKKTKGQLQVLLDGEYKAQFMASDTGRSDKTDFAAKKRKLKEWQQSQGYSDTLQNSGTVSVKEEISESELQREKKVRSCKFDEKESSASKADGITEKKGGATKILIPGYRDSIADGMKDESRGANKTQGNLLSQRTRDGIDLSKREPGYAAQTSMAATSSSSKVSGSRKGKGNLPEVKDSPVESVCSSPLRGSNIDKLTTAARRNVLGKDDTTNLCFPVGGGSPRRCSDGETDGRSDRSGTVKKEKASLEFQMDVGSSLLHGYQDGFANQMSSRKFKSKMLSKSFGGQSNSLSVFENTNAVNSADTADQHNSYLIEEHGKDPDHDLEKPYDRYQIDGSGERKLGKDSSSLPKGKHKSAKFDFDKDKVKVSNSCSEQEELHPTKSSGLAGSYRYEAEFESRDHSLYHDNLRNGKYVIQKTNNINSDMDNNYLVKKDSTKKQPGEGQRDDLLNLVTQGSPLQIRHHTDLNSRGKKSGKKDEKYNLQKNLPDTMPCDNEKSSELFPSDGTDRPEMASGRVKSKSFHPGEKQELDGKGSRPDTFPVDATVSGTMKVPKQPNGAHHSNVRKPTPNGIVCRDISAPSPVIKDHGQAAKVLKEAKDLKHSADRLKSGGGELESTNLFFRAALKFLHGASLLELSSSESAKNGETNQSMNYYTDTASLCRFCAYEYEKCKEMAAAALAYKCIEVAYMRVIFSKHRWATRDHCKLQKALQTAAQGESPSSSASDVDDLNNQATFDKMALGKGTSSPQNVGNHVIPASSHPSYTRMLNYVKDMNSAMEASQKSQNAFAAAKVGLKEARYRPEDISSVRSVLDFNFHDVERLIHLVRLAMEAICC